MMKKIAVFLTVVMMLCICATPAMAAEPINEEGTITVTVTNPDGRSESFVFDLNDCSGVSFDAEGNLLPEPRYSISAHDIGAYGGRYYYTGTGNLFYIIGGVSVTFSVNLKSSATVSLGYIFDGVEHTTATVTSKSPSTTFVAPSTGGYALVLRNKTGSTISVTGGSISY